MDLLTSSVSSVTAVVAGRQLEHGRHRGHLGGSTMVNLLLRWALLDAVAEFGTPTVTVALTWVLSVRGCKGFGQEQEGGERKCNVGVNRDNRWSRFF